MTDITRRDWLKTVGAVSAGALVPIDMAQDGSATTAGSTVSAVSAARAHAPGDIIELTSTSEIFTPPRGRSYMKFSFDFPEPSVSFGDYRFGFLVFTNENTYGLDRSTLRVEGTGDAIRLIADGFVWAGGQEKAPGRFVASLRRTSSVIEWDATVEMERPIKTVSTIIRGVPRGQVSLGAGPFTDLRDGEMLGGYPFGGGDLHGPGSANGMTTPLLMIQASPTDIVYVTPLDDTVRP